MPGFGDDRNLAKYIFLIENRVSLEILSECRRLAQQAPGLTAIVLISTLLQVGYRLSIPYFFQQIFDRGIIAADADVLYRSVAGCGLALGIFAVAILCQERAMSRLATEAASRLRRSLFTKLLAMPSGLHSGHSASGLVNRMGGDVDLVEQALFRGVPLLLVQVTLVLTSVAILFLIEWRLALVVLCSLPLTVLVSKPFRREAVRTHQGVQTTRSRMLRLTQEASLGHIIVRLFGNHVAASRRFAGVVEALGAACARMNFLTALSGRSSQVASGFTQLVVIGLGGWLAFNGYMTGGLLVAFITLLSNVSGAVGHIGEASTALSRGAMALRELRTLLTQPGDIADHPNATALAPLRDAIRFDGVTFGYGVTPIVRDVSFSIQAGERVCIIGPSGSGKSTILALLVRLHEPQGGIITFDGIPLARATEASLRDVVTMVTQTPILFQGSIHDNIVLARPDAGPVAVAQAIRGAALDDVVALLPGGDDADVGEGGQLLSGGQRQRVAIARSLIRDASVLVLDEATSALDPAAEEIVNRTILDTASRSSSFGPVTARPTVIAVTHRLTAAASFDRVLVFDQGRLVQDGPHARLVAEAGVYQRLWRKVAGLELRPDGGAHRISAEWLSTLPFLAECPPDLLEPMSSLFLSEELTEGREVFRQGDHGERFFILVWGTVEVMIEDPGGSPRRVAVLQDGDFFGEVALLSDAPRNATIRTVTDCWFLTLHRTPFLALLKQAPAVRAQITAAMAARRTDTPELRMG